MSTWKEERTGFQGLCLGGATCAKAIIPSDHGDHSHLLSPRGKSQGACPLTPTKHTLSTGTSFRVFNNDTKAEKSVVNMNEHSLYPCFSTWSTFSLSPFSEAQASVHTEFFPTYNRYLLLSYL